MLSKYRLVYNRHKHKNKEGTSLIQIEATINGIRKFIETGVRIDSKYWDNRNKLVAPVDETHGKYNIYLNNLLTSIKNFEMDCHIHGKPFNIDILRDFVSGGYDKPMVTFNEYCRKYLAEERGLTESSKVAIGGTLDVLDEFGTFFFHQLTPKFVKEFTNFLYDRKASHNTIAKHHKNIKRFINIATEDPDAPMTRDQYPYNKRNTINFKRTRFEFLTLEEIDRINSLEYENGSDMWLTQKRFVLSCYTGLRFSDICKLNMGHLRNGENGMGISIMAQKTGNHVYLPLNRFFSGKGENIVRELTEKGKFPRFHMDRKYLPQVLKDAGIEREIIFHTARHSFCTNLAYETNGNVLAIMKYAGIKQVNTAMTYIHDADSYYDFTSVSQAQPQQQPHPQASNSF